MAVYQPPGNAHLARARVLHIVQFLARPDASCCCRTVTASRYALPAFLAM